ncbi:MAG: hypothetical protein IKG21_09245 [Atopobiaceae bacterium]|nr:hypothetical protein [Atopobiaceae bacterium]
MGGRGTYASGNNVPYTYETVGNVAGIKVLKKIGQKNQHKLPEEAHSSSMYARLNKDGTLRELRFYDGKHRLRLEIASHPEVPLAKRGGLPAGTPILHYHTYDKDFVRSPAEFLTPAMRKRYAQLFGRSWT